MAVLLGAAPATAAYYDMIESQAGASLVVTSTITTSDYIRTPARGFMRMSSTKGSTLVYTIYVCDTKEYVAASCTSKGSVSATDDVIDIETGRNWLILDVTTAETAGSPSFISVQRNLQNAGIGGGGSVSAAGLDGAYMTPTTVAYLSSLKTFEGLDPKIPWTRYWIDPYNGSDSNNGSYTEPFRTLGKWKSLAGFGTWFTIKNGGRSRPMYISNQTFPFPTGETCVVGEVVTSGAKTARILDIDLPSGNIVFETVGGTPLVATDAITTATQSGAGCSWTLGTRTPAIWDGTLALCALDNTDTCLVANRYTTTGCTGAGANVCWAASEAPVNLSSVPSTYEGRIVSIIDSEDPSMPPIVHADFETLGDLNNTEAGANRDNGALFFASDNGTNLSYGCLGVANIWTDAVLDDIVSQGGEGCVKALNVRASRVWNTSNAKNNNVVTTHGGTAGRGGVVSINGTGTSYRYDDSGGSPVAPTGASFMTLIGQGSYSADMTNWGAATTSSVVGMTGGALTMIGHDVYCQGTSGATLGCTGIAVVAQDDVATVNLIDVLARHAKNSALHGINLQTNGYGITSKIYRPSLGAGTDGRGIQTYAANGAISLDVKGAIFDDLTYYMMDFSTYADAAHTTTATVDGVYDNDGSSRWYFDSDATKNYATAAGADAAMATWDIMTGTYAVQTDATEYTTDFGRRCSSAGSCWNTYSESFSVDFPKVIYDYLPVGIHGYAENGTRNYGAR